MAPPLAGTALARPEIVGAAFKRTVPPQSGPVTAPAKRLRWAPPRRPALRLPVLRTRATASQPPRRRAKAGAARPVLRRVRRRARARPTSRLAPAPLALGSARVAAGDGPSSGPGPCSAPVGTARPAALRLRRAGIGGGSAPLHLRRAPHPARRASAPLRAPIPREIRRRRRRPASLRGRAGVPVGTALSSPRQRLTVARRDGWRAKARPRLKEFSAPSASAPPCLPVLPRAVPGDEKAGGHTARPVVAGIFPPCLRTPSPPARRLHRLPSNAPPPTNSPSFAIA